MAVDELAHLLRGMSLFASFADDDLHRLASCCAERQYPKTTTIWRAGAEASELLLVIEGELTIWGEGDRDVVARLGPGSTVGEMGLLSDQRRSATVTASRDTRAVTLRRDDFNAFVGRDHRVLAALGTTLSRRLERATKRVQPPVLSLIVAVVAVPGQLGSTLVATSLAELLAMDTGQRVLRLDIAEQGQPTEAMSSGEAGHGSKRGEVVTVGRGRSEAETLATLSGLVAKMSRQDPILVLDVPARSGLGAAAVAQLADVVVILESTSSDHLTDDRHTRVLRVRNRSTSPFEPWEPNSYRLGEVEEISGLPAIEAARVLVANGVSPASRLLGRMARTIERRVVGVALGAGAALGLAHIGVLRELDSAHIPVDVLAGSSMGGVVALGYAAGGGASHLEAVAQRQSSLLRLLGTVDLAVTGDGLLRGRRLSRYLRPYLQGAESFSDLVVPAKVVATDLATAEAVGIGEGAIEQAMRASTAMPPFLAPVMDGRRVLVDGGLINPVPCDVVKAMGADIVLAINVVPPPDSSSATVLTQASRLLNRLNPLAYLTGRTQARNLFDIVMHSFQISEHELGSHLARSADVILEPRLGSHTWIEFYRASEIMERGAEAARLAIPHIRDVLARRLVESMPCREASRAAPNT